MPIGVFGWEGGLREDAHTKIIFPANICFPGEYFAYPAIILLSWPIFCLLGQYFVSPSPPGGLGGRGARIGDLGQAKIHVFYKDPRPDRPRGEG